MVLWNEDKYMSYKYYCKDCHYSFTEKVKIKDL